MKFNNDNNANNGANNQPGTGNNNEAIASTALRTANPKLANLTNLLRFLKRPKINVRTNLAPNLNNPTNKPIKCTKALIAIAVTAANASFPNNGARNNPPASNASARLLANELNSQILNPINAFTNDRNRKFKILPRINNGTTTRKKNPATNANNPNFNKFFKTLFNKSNPIRASVVNN